MKHHLVKLVSFAVAHKFQLKVLTCNGGLKAPSQPSPFSMPSKLLILHGEVKSYCFTVSCVSESMFRYL